MVVRVRALAERVIPAENQATTRPAGRSYATALLWTAYIAVPCRAIGLFHGVPLRPFDAFVLLLIWWLLLVNRRVPGSGVAAAATVVVLLFTMAIPGEPGFRARYYANADARGPFEPGTERWRKDFTRVDQRLEFSREGPELPLAFFNDVDRFNYYKPTDPARALLPFAVRWDASWWTGTGAVPHTLYIDAPQAAAAIVVDGTIVASVTPAGGRPTGVVAPARGWHQLHVRFSSPYAAPRRFSAGEQIGDRRVPFDGSAVRTRRIAEWQQTTARMFDLTKTVFDGCSVAVVLWICAAAVWDVRGRLAARGETRERRFAIGALFAILAVAEACLFASHFAGRLWVLQGGDDPLMYEWYSRRILLEGPLMRFLDEPYHWQVLYPYVLAVAHALFGESMFGPMLLQRLLLPVVAWTAAAIAVTIAGVRVWPAAFVCSALFAYWKIAPISAQLLNESLFIPLLVAWTAMLQRAMDRPSSARIVRTALMGGVAALVRTTALAALVCALPFCWAAWKHAPRARYVMQLVLLTCCVVSLIAVRNWIVVHRFVPLPLEFGATLVDGNPTPPGLALDFSRHGPLYDRLHLDGQTRQVVEYAVTAPRDFARNLGHKALFVLGCYEPYAPGWGYSATFITIWVASLVGLALALWTGTALPAAVVLPMVVCATQLITVAVIYPKNERYLLPGYSLLVPYGAVVLSRVFDACTTMLRTAFASAITAVNARFAGGPQSRR